MMTSTRDRRQARLHHGAALVHAAALAAHDPIDDAHQLLDVSEADFVRSQACRCAPRRPGPVRHQHFGDRFVLRNGSSGPLAQDRGHDLG